MAIKIVRYLVALLLVLVPMARGSVPVNEDLSIDNIVNAFIERRSAVNEMRTHAALDCLLHERSRLVALFDDFPEFTLCTSSGDEAYTFPRETITAPTSILHHKYAHEIGAGGVDVDTDGDPSTPDVPNVLKTGNFDVYEEFWTATATWRSKVADMAGGWSVIKQEALDSALEAFDVWFDAWPQAKQTLLGFSGDNIPQNSSNIATLQSQIDDATDNSNWERRDLLPFRGTRDRQIVEKRDKRNGGPYRDPGLRGLRSHGPVLKATAARWEQFASGELGIDRDGRATGFGVGPGA